MEEKSHPAPLMLPRYSQLPDIGLYMDQVIALTERFLGPIFNGETTILTASMVNNYVKQHLLPPPYKKRYNREHVARLIAICILKQVLSIPEIDVLLKELFLEEDFARNYDSWCDTIELAFEELNRKECSHATLAAISVAGKSLVLKDLT